MVMSSGSMLVYSIPDMTVKGRCSAGAGLGISTTCFGGCSDIVEYRFTMVKERKKPARDQV